MRSPSLLFVMLAVGIPGTLNAQQWNAEQMGVINSVKACWDTWVEGIRRRNPEQWLAECSDGESVYWGTADGSPRVGTPDQLRRRWEAVSRADRKWIDLRPLSIKIVGDMAIMHFYGLWEQNTPEGQIVVNEAKRMEVFRRAGNRWVQIAGQATPVSRP